MKVYDDEINGIAAKAKEQQIRKPAEFVIQKSGEQKPIRTDILENSTKSSPINTRLEIAKAAGAEMTNTGLQKSVKAIRKG